MTTKTKDTAADKARHRLDGRRASRDAGERQGAKGIPRRSPAEEREAGEADVLANIADMPTADRLMAERIHALVTASAPTLAPKTYYGMPAYARDGKLICFYKPASKFKVRYSTFEFQPDARLDDGEMWPVSFAVTKRPRPSSVDRRAGREGSELRSL